MEALKPDIIVVETLGSHGRSVQQRDRVALHPDKRGFTIGRSAAADVIVDDPYAAPLHALVEITAEGTLAASDLGTVNGIIVSGQRHKGAQQVALRDGLLQIGRTRLRLRVASEALPPERPDRAGIAQEQGSASGAAAASFAACAVYVAYLGWLETPRDIATAIVVMSIPILAFAGLWIALWALLSRVMRGEWRWLWHSAILFTVMATYALSESLLDAGWFAYSLPRWESRDTLLAAIAFGVAFYWHLTRASSVSHRRAAFIAILLPATVAGGALWIQSRTQERNVNYIGVNEKVYPPALRVRKAVEVQGYFDRAEKLKAVADSSRRKIPADDEGDSFMGEE